VITEYRYRDVAGLKEGRGLFCTQGFLLYFVKEFHTIFEEKPPEKYRRNRDNCIECTRRVQVEF
jgi:hypothetical protein